MRKGPFQTNLLLGGVDEKTNEVSLYWMDYFAAMSKVNYGCHGHAAHFLLSIFDREFPSPHAKPGSKASIENDVKLLSEEEGLELCRKCIKELHTRFMVSQPHFIIKIVDKNGIRELKLD